MAGEMSREMDRKRPAIFLDRDGVLTRLIANPRTGEFEPPQRAEDLRLTSGVAGAIGRLRAAGYVLAVISNQPDWAKGKVDGQELSRIEARFVERLGSAGVQVDGVYYCHHHPRGVVRELAVACDCRKPATGLVRRAASELGIDTSRSWFVGDRDTDVECGRASGCRTVLVRSEESKREGWGHSSPDFVVSGLTDAVDAILG